MNKQTHKWGGNALINCDCKNYGKVRHLGVHELFTITRLLGYLLSIYWESPSPSPLLKDILTNECCTVYSNKWVIIQRNVVTKF